MTIKKEKEREKVDEKDLKSEILRLKEKKKGKESIKLQ